MHLDVFNIFTASSPILKISAQNGFVPEAILSSVTKHLKKRIKVV